jgi:hypothetical protein
VFKFELNGVTISDQPDGWESINTSIKRDSLSGGLYFDSDINLTCYGGQDLFISLRDYGSLIRSEGQLLRYIRSQPIAVMC